MEEGRLDFRLKLNTKWFSKIHFTKESSCIISSKQFQTNAIVLCPTIWMPDSAYRFPSLLGTDLSPNLGTFSSPNLGIPQICPQILGQIRSQISWIPEFVPKFRDTFVPKFGESSNFGTNFGTNSSPITPTTSWAFSFPNLRTSLSPNLGSYQIFPYILGKLFKPIKVLTKFIPKF